MKIGRTVHKSLEARWWNGIDLYSTKKLPATEQQNNVQKPGGGDEPNPRVCL